MKIKDRVVIKNIDRQIMFHVDRLITVALHTSWLVGLGHLHSLPLGLKTTNM
jgi:hypothetical protein